MIMPIKPLRYESQSRSHREEEMSPVWANKKIGNVKRLVRTSTVHRNTILI